MNSHIKWEYKHVSRLALYEDVLQKLGEAGWELTAIEPGTINVFWFKRPMINRSNNDGPVAVLTDI
jgi:hypothetical protein